MKRLGLVLSTLLIPAVAHAQLFEDVTGSTIGSTSEWSNKVDLADLNGDGRVDILFANGGNYSTPDVDSQGRQLPQPNRLFLNEGPGSAFTEATSLLGAPDIARVIKGQDVNGDGHVDIFVGAVYEGQSRLYLGDGVGGFKEVTDSHLPQIPASVGDIEFGDMDDDGDLDVVLGDWGPGDPFKTDGGRIMLWLNTGDGHFEDATEAQMPDDLVAWTWDLEVMDIDNDYDLDIIVSCKVCDGGALYVNEQGTFEDHSDRLPQFTNNYEFEFADFNGDGFLDVVTINDGEQIGGNQFNKREHIFLGNGEGFDDATDELWPDNANVGFDDNAIVVLDFDSDGDPDFIIGSLDGDDRLLVNDGTGKLSLETDVFGGAGTPGTLGIAVSDLNDDGRLDCVQSQGELAEEERVYFGSEIAIDTAAPVISHVKAGAGLDGAVVRGRVHDNKSPVKAHDFQHVTLTFTVDGKNESTVPMTWYGEQLWRARVDAPQGSKVEYSVCAADAAGNDNCETGAFTVGAGDDQSDGDGDERDDDKSGGCTTSGGGSGAAHVGLLLLAVFVLRRRRADG